MRLQQNSEARRAVVGKFLPKPNLSTMPFAAIPAFAKPPSANFTDSKFRLRRSVAAPYAAPSA